MVIQGNIDHWNPWHGCRKKSEGCANCYFLAGNKKRNVEGSNIIKRSVTNFTYPIDKKRNGSYKVQSGTTLMTTMSSDFFIEDADEWREEAWRMIKSRYDLTFMIVTKRPERIIGCLPDDWGNGYENVFICVSVENQERSDERLPILMSIPCVRRWVFVAPMLSKIDMSEHLSKHLIQDVSCGGESGEDSRPCNYDWVVSLRNQCIANNTNFFWYNAGSKFVKDGIEYKLNTRDQFAVCNSAKIDHICIPLPKQTKKVSQKKLF